MKLYFTHERNDAINDILIYLYHLGYKECGTFHDVHSKTYDLGVAANFEGKVEYKGLEFTLTTHGEHKVIGHKIEKYREMCIEGENKLVVDFCKKAFKYGDERINETRIADKLNIYAFDCCWGYLESAEKRPLTSLNLPKTQVNDIVKDITQFVQNSTLEKYRSLGIPHSRTYMLYGPPGTGKTSLIKGIASSIDYGISIVEFDKELDDKSLKRAIAKRPKNTILVFEDIDCLFESRKKSDEFSTQVTFSGLLNTFDGVVTHENLIVIFTTNHLEILDHALKRRIDYFLKFDYATKTQIKHMYDRFYPTQSADFNSFYDTIKHIKLTPNILQKFFTKHLYDNIIEYAPDLVSFATGEIAVESLENFYT